MLGSYVGQTSNGVLPQLYGRVSAARQKYDEVGDFQEGVFSQSYVESQNAGFYSGRNNTGKRYIIFNANNYNSIYGSGWFDGERVVPASIGMNYCMRY